MKNTLALFLFNNKKETNYLKNIRTMKTTTLKALLILGGLMLLNNQTMNAGIVSEFKNFVGNEFTHFSFTRPLCYSGRNSYGTNVSPCF